MPPERSIHVLPDNVINMIAAGEVVERPRSVLKELVENSLDSGARKLDIAIVAGGKKLVSVTDDGCGMGRDDALLSVERHATSKLRDIHDIEQIGTLGFRGEALAAICSVSRFRIRTCREGDEAGTEVAIAGGKMQDVRDVGTPPGTAVEVRDLFFNVPARRKFLRSDDTELVHLRQYFVTQAIARPDVGMTLSVDERIVHRLPEDSSLRDRIAELFGTDFFQKLVPVDYVTEGLTVKGFVSVPIAHRGDRNEQLFFINTRPVSSGILNMALGEAYHALLPSGRHPSVFLFISTPPSSVDVNVHPTKKEVRFRRPSDVRTAVTEAVRRALSTGGFKAKMERQTPFDRSVAPPAQPAGQGSLAIDDLPAAKPFQYPRQETEDRKHEAGDNGQEAGQGGVPLPPAAKAGQADDTRTASAAPWAWCRVLGQIGGLFVFLETEDGYVIMDPHAAHERVLFDRLMAEIMGSRVAMQGLLVTENVALSPADAHRVRRSLDTIRAMGFGVAEFGGDTFVVDAVPACLGDVSPSVLLKDIASALSGEGVRNTASGIEESVARAACKAAVKARDHMTLAEIEQLVVALAGSEMPYTCPHGRPTLIYTSFSELRRKFGRE